jgi:Lecithin retinol acyltransferase
MQHVADLGTLAPGTQLVARYRGYLHSGIYVGCGRVIHYAGRLQYPRGLVEEISLAEFSGGRPVYVGSEPSPFTRMEDVVRRARDRLGECSYDLLLNNCEHFCTWCQTGQPRSAQVDRLTRGERLLVRAIERAIAAIAHSLRYAFREHRRARDPCSFHAAAADCRFSGKVSTSSLAQAV